MKITVKKFGDPSIQTLEQLADKYDLEMEAVERDLALWFNDKRARYFARFQHVDVMKDGFLLGVFGDGETPSDAIAKYAERLRGRRIVIRPMDKSKRVELDLSNDFHSETRSTDEPK